MDEERKIKLQKLIDRIARDSRNAHNLAQELYGPNAQLFAECDGSLVVMSDDCLGSPASRQDFIVMDAFGEHRFGVGAW